MTNIRFHSWLLFTCLLISGLCRGGLEQEVVTSNAYDSNINSVSFQQDAIVTYKGYQYAVYWSRNRHVAVARKALAGGSWETLELTDFQFATANAHYDISLGVSPLDGTLHLSFDQWSSSFRYRKSVPHLLDDPSSFAWNKSLFGSLQNHLQGTPMTPTTYPRFITEPSGKMLLLLRHGESGAGDSYLYEYNGDSGQWSTVGKLVDGLATNINAYFNGIHYDANGRLHSSWVWRATPDASTNFDLHYIYSDDDGRSWKNNAGTTIATTGSNPIKESSPGITVWKIAQNRGLINQESQIIDSEGRISLLMSHMRDNAPSTSDFEQARHNAYVYHYQRDLSGNWSRQQLAGSSFSYDRNKIVVDRDNNLYAIINRDGIYRAQANNNWQDWTLLQSLVDQTLYGEVQIDRERLLIDDTLSFINLSAPGFMRVYHFTDDGRTSESPAGGAPEDYIFCAREDEVCTFSGVRDIAYGASGKFTHRRESGSFTCNKGSLGDPIRGTVKRCYYSSITVGGSSQWPEGYKLCAGQGGLCRFEGTSSVAFGANGQFHYRIATGEIACSSSEFGDPVSGVSKSCYIYPQSLSEPGYSSSSSSSSASTSSSTSSSSSSSSASSNSSSTSGSGEEKAGAVDRLLLIAFVLLGLLGVQRRFYFRND